MVPAPLTTPDGSVVASYGRRVGGYVLDALFTSVLTIAPAVWATAASIHAMTDFFDALDPETGELPPGSSFHDYFDGLWWQLLTAIAISYLLVFAYHLIFLRLWSTTPGKRILGLRVRRWALEGPLDWATAAKRAGMQYGVFALLSILYVNVLDGLWPLWDERRQALHDKVASTVVIDVRPADTP